MEGKPNDAQPQYAGSHPQRRRNPVFYKRIQRGIDSRHRAGSGRQSRQRHLPFQEQGRPVAGDLQAPLRADEQAPHRTSRCRQARARRAGPAGGDRARLCAAGVFVEQRSGRRRRAVHAAARGDVGGRQRRGRAASSPRSSTTPPMRSSRPSSRACRICRARPSSGDRSSCSARSITPSSTRSACRGCRAAKPMAAIWPRPSSSWFLPPSLRCRRPIVMTGRRRGTGYQSQPQESAGTSRARTA